jgi:hypothetical protein
MHQIAMQTSEQAVAEETAPAGTAAAEVQGKHGGPEESTAPKAALEPEEALKPTKDNPE